MVPECCRSSAELHDFQLKLALAIQNGLDGAILASCGMCKSACLYVPVKAAILRHREALMILVVPTKALSEDQAKSANARGLRAVAINRDTMRAALNETPPRKLLNEVETGLWDLAKQTLVSSGLLVSSRTVGCTLL
ncbi:hypothetical protein NEOLEDRAFT_1184867 [Neolentinus lepideus HHB14362 ss-1]|uniref:DEAD/DEAH box helicase domain-containing protein n=1 Tax=Neolentinus lepideus HHB14362 ss-1 TaxID=1314782 RepID=A0A165L6Y5_9AGAM|nr:hypothetical protein NEOLEDRAFT_1184867 [Neolentinus lepideus HHB14362 ss-1]